MLLLNIGTFVLLPLLAALTGANPLGTKPVVSRFKSSIHEDLSLRFVANSGVCETTPGVHQISGYIEVGKNMSMVHAYVLNILGKSLLAVVKVVLVLRSERVSRNGAVHSLVKWRPWMFFHDRPLSRERTMPGQS